MEKILAQAEKKTISALKKELVKRRDGLYISTSRSLDIAAEDNFQQVQTMTESIIWSFPISNILAYYYLTYILHSYLC